MDVDSPSGPSSRLTMNRRRFLGSLAATAAATAIYPCYYEPRWLDVTRHNVALGGKDASNDSRANATVAALAPLRVLHMADLHASLAVPLSMIDHAVSKGI